MEVFADGFLIGAYEGAQPYRISCSGANAVADSHWYWGFKHSVESFRGLDDTEDLFSPGYFDASLEETRNVTIEMTCEDDEPLDYAAVDAETDKQQRALLKSIAGSAPDWIQQLVLASDQFVVERYDRGKAAGNTAGNTIIAGYPWFSDWGRDTMIALPGLTLR